MLYSNMDILYPIEVSSSIFGRIKSIHPWKAVKGSLVERQDGSLEEQGEGSDPGQNRIFSLQTGKTEIPDFWIKMDASVFVYFF